MSSDNCQINYTWVIKDIDEFIEDRKKRWSPCFMDVNEKSAWRIEIGVTILCKAYFYIHLHSLETPRVVLLMKKFTFSIVTPTFGGSALSRSKIITNESDRSDFSYLLRMDELQDYIFQNTLTIVCTVTECVEQNQTSVFKPLMDNMILSDVKILVGNDKFSAHKIILHVHSPVFAKMFLHESKESINNEVEIKEMSSEIFKELLRYMYAGKVKNLESKAKEILIAANRYEIEGLISMCGYALCKQMTLENVAGLIVLAEDHNASILKKYCSIFILQNYGDFIKSKGFKDLEKTHVNLIVDLAVTIGLEYKLQVKN